MRANSSNLFSLVPCAFLEYKKLSRSQVGWAYKDCFLRQSGGLGLGTNLFLRRSALWQKEKNLLEGDRVSFDVGQGTKGPAAQNVTKL